MGMAVSYLARRLIVTEMANVSLYAAKSEGNGSHQLIVQICVITAALIDLPSIARSLGIAGHMTPPAIDASLTDLPLLGLFALALGVGGIGILAAILWHVWRGQLLLGGRSLGGGHGLMRTASREFEADYDDEDE